jgi:hypothetical protein
MIHITRTVVIGDGLTSRVFQNVFNGPLVVVRNSSILERSDIAKYNLAYNLGSKFFPSRTKDIFNKFRVDFVQYLQRPGDYPQVCKDLLNLVEGLSGFRILTTKGRDYDLQNFPLGKYSNSISLSGPHGSSSAWGGFLSICSPDSFVEFGEYWKNIAEDFESARNICELFGAETILKIPNALGYKSLEHQSFSHSKWTKLGNTLNIQSGIVARSSVFEPNRRGRCEGIGTCPTCPNDAVTVPKHIRANSGVEYLEKEAKSIQFINGVWKVSFSDGSAINAINLILAAGPVETVKLLIASKLIPNRPRAVSDHAPVEFNVYPLDDIQIYDNLESKVPIPVILENGTYIVNGRHIKSNMPSLRSKIIYTELEITPKDGFEISIDLDGYSHLEIEDQKWLTLQKELERVVDELAEKLSKNFIISKILPHYRHGLGGHHLTSALYEDLTFEDQSPRLIGTANLYVLGPATHPRAFNAGPVLTSSVQAVHLANDLNSRI